MWLFSCFLLFILTTPAWAQPQPPAAGNLLTLEEAVNIALQDSRQVKNAALEVSKSEHLLAATRTRRWPNFQVIVAENWLLTPQQNFNALGGLPNLSPYSHSRYHPHQPLLKPAAHRLYDRFNGPTPVAAVPHRSEHFLARRHAGYSPGRTPGQAPDRG